MVLIEVFEKLYNIALYFSINVYKEWHFYFSLHKTLIYLPSINIIINYLFSKQTNILLNDVFIRNLLTIIYRSTYFIKNGPLNVTS